MNSSDEAAVYLLASSMCNAFMDLQWLSVMPPSNRLTACVAQIDRLPNVRNTLYAVEFVTPERNRQVTRAVNSVIETIKRDTLATGILNEQDASLLKTFLDSMSLVLPSVMDKPAIKPVHFALNFTEKLLEGRAAEFETRLSLMRQGIPFESANQTSAFIALQSGGKILVSPKLYPLVRADSTHADVFNTPILASALAKSIWHFIITEKELWSYRVRTSIEDYVACFRTYYFGKGSKERSAKDEVDTVAASLALWSVLRSFAESRWFKPEKAWRHWSLSHSQFFFMRETFYSCPSYYSGANKDKVDVPLMYSGDFAAAFQCRAHDRMAKQRTCFLALL
ncbi:hypothetical protein HPB48_007784 [Haemaphysalis longicornis]|uniref:Uncharacterized protein n=1 Tax=Haemaphysalis longicornis TaxID=44386 RepID=A0A9J6GCZ1_HAELO|nr:hypothetical protein HPB48_007784 [Haemaphysalis longicornis]